MPLEGLDKILIATNVHVAAFPYSRGIDEFLTQLAVREEIDISRLAAGGQTPTDKQLLRFVVALTR